MLDRGFRQIIAWRGLSHVAPLEGLGLEDLYLLMEVTHFQLQNMSCDESLEMLRLATIRLRHRMDGRTFPLIYRFHCEPGFPPTASGAIAETFGYTPDNPILCDDPMGEIEFINSLRCPNGHPFRGFRIGSMDGHCTCPNTHCPPLSTETELCPPCIVDRYELRCLGGEHTCELFFDMYHPGSASQSTPSGLIRVSDD
ncbi:MAG: hypothetical protein KDB01_14375 [Planctomycetaceae bacterium]|nr:hypothetical protein [Planctomycetaceae bacterium]